MLLQPELQINCAYPIDTFASICVNAVSAVVIAWLSLGWREGAAEEEFWE